jgi:putative transposase
MTEGTGDCYQNALAERVNGILKDEFLFVTATDLAEARQLVAQAVHLYNHERPHLALNYLTPNQVHQLIKSISKPKAPPENPNGALAFFLSTFRRTGH